LKKVTELFKKRKFLFSFLLLVLIGYLFPQKFSFPVKGATKKDFSQQSFWYYPWGKSVTHKGVDIFSPVGTDVYSSTGGIVLYSGTINMGGNVVFILGPKWRLHYYAHLSKIETSFFSFISSGELIGKVGQSGNAAGKSPHLHYSVNTLIPLPWQIDGAKQGWKKMFYVNPIPFLNEAAN
jgi:murein DD-endopeptidase MepM/ murein hydrolase activator NlpD